MSNINQASDFEVCTIDEVKGYIDHTTNHKLNYELLSNDSVDATLDQVLTLLGNG